MDTYIQRVDKYPCGDTVINLHKGADSTHNQDVQKNYKYFLKQARRKGKNHELQSLSSMLTFLVFDK